MSFSMIDPLPVSGCSSKPERLANGLALDNCIVEVIWLTTQNSHRCFWNLLNILELNHLGGAIKHDQKLSSWGFGFSRSQSLESSKPLPSLIILFAICDPQNMDRWTRVEIWSSRRFRISILVRHGSPTSLKNFNTNRLHGPCSAWFSLSKPPSAKRTVVEPTLPPGEITHDFVP